MLEVMYVLVYSSDVVYGEKSNVVVFADVDGEYAVVIGDGRFIVDVVSGVGNVEIALDAGSYDIIVEYVNDNYVNNVTSVPFTVSKANVTLSVEIFDKVYGANVTGNVFASVEVSLVLLLVIMRFLSLLRMVLEVSMSDS